MRLTFTLEPQPSTEKENLIINPLIAYNEAQAGPRNSKRFALFVRSESSDLVGGLLGSTHWNHFFVSALFVHEDARREGIGRELMKRAEALALEQNCEAIFLDTFDFQAPGFYEKLGFKVFGTLPDYPVGHKRFYLVKRIRSR
jgi:GNAT superfamily N-acetyltransferase